MIEKVQELRSKLEELKERYSEVRGFF